MKDYTSQNEHCLKAKEYMFCKKLSKEHTQVQNKYSLDSWLWKENDRYKILKTKLTENSSISKVYIYKD